MIDLEFLRNHADLYRRAIITKRVQLNLDELLAVDAERRQIATEVNGLRAERNRITDLVATIPAAGGPVERHQLIAESRAVGERLVLAEEQLNQLNSRFNELAALLPGLPRFLAPPIRLVI